MDPLQLAASLVAILLLAGLAAWLKLGSAARLTSEFDAHRAADMASDGFAPVRCSLDQDGKGAIMQDGSGQIMVLKPHGSHFAGRILEPAASGEMLGNCLLVKTSERRFGDVHLTLADAPYWANAINALSKASHA